MLCNDQMMESKVMLCFPRNALFSTHPCSLTGTFCSCCWAKTCMHGGHSSCHCQQSIFRKHLPRTTTKKEELPRLLVSHYIGTSYQQAGRNTFMACTNGRRGAAVHATICSQILIVYSYDPPLAQLGKERDHRTVISVLMSFTISGPVVLSTSCPQLNKNTI